MVVLRKAVLSPSSVCRIGLWMSSPRRINTVVAPCHPGWGATRLGLSLHHGRLCVVCPWGTSVMRHRGHHQLPSPDSIGWMWPLPTHWVWPCCPPLLLHLTEVCIGIPRDPVVMGHPVLKHRLWRSVRMKWSESYVCNYGSMKPGWPPERSVTQNPCGFARRFCRNRSSDVTGRYRLAGIIRGHGWLCWYKHSTCACMRWRHSVLKYCLWRSSRIHRTVVTYITFVLPQVMCSFKSSPCNTCTPNHGSQLYPINLFTCGMFQTGVF